MKPNQTKSNQQHQNQINNQIKLHQHQININFKSN